MLSAPLGLLLWGYSLVVLVSEILQWLIVCLESSTYPLAFSHVIVAAAIVDTATYVLAWAGELKLSVRDLLAFTCGDRERAASLRALRTRADTLSRFSGVFSDAGAGAVPSFAFSFITCAHAMAMSG